MIDRRLCVAPMMGRTDASMRDFLRRICKKSVLFTEMIPVQAVTHGDYQKILSFDLETRPLVLQLGGADPDLLAKAVHISENFDYDEINLNVGCPSPRVKKGAFGACLFKRPDHLGECIKAMRGQTAKPVSIKMRTGVDDHDDDTHLQRFVEITHRAGCSIFYVHARKAWLNGLSPKDNRSIPPLDYQRVRRLKQNFPELTIILNGGIKSASEALEHINDCDGVMIGRAVCRNPWVLVDIAKKIDPETHTHKSRYHIAEELIERLFQHRISLKNKSEKPLRLAAWSGLFYGIEGSTQWRRILAEVKNPQKRENFDIFLKNFMDSAPPALSANPARARMQNAE